jgi:O-antigen/teichoic acid export membrane protein
MDLPPISELDASSQLAPAVDAAPAPPHPLPSMVYLAGALATGNVLSSVLRTVGGVLQARFVTVPMMGLFCTLNLVLEYGLMAQLGVFNGLNRELPYFSGKGDHRRINELAATAQAWGIVVSSLVALGMLPLAVWYAVCGDMWRTVGWTFNVLFTFFCFYSSQPISYLQVTYRTGHDFAHLAFVGVVQNALGLVLVLLVVWFNFYGMCLRSLITAAVAAYLLHHWRPVRVGPKWNTAHLKHLMIIGLPIYGVGLLYYWWTLLLSKTLVVAYLGESGLGLYYVVITAVGMIELLPAAVSQVVYPRMAEHYGRTGTLRAIVRMAVKPILLTAVGMIPIIATAWWLVEPAMRWVLPQYVDAVPAIRWGLLVPFVSSFAPVNLMFNVVRRQELYAAAILIGMAAYGGCLWWLLRGGVTLVRFPQAMLIGQVVFMLCSYAFVAYLVRREVDAT